MSESPDGLVRLRQLVFDRATACTSRAASEVGKARELLDVKRNDLASIRERREAASKQLCLPRDARWLAHRWAFDLRLAEDSLRVRQEMDRAESDLTGRREELQKSKRELALAQVKLGIARNLVRRRGKASIRRRERRLEDEVSGIRTRCL